MENNNFFKKAFNDMKESAKLQHEVNKAELDATKAESKANFENNRGSLTYQRAKQNNKQKHEARKENERKIAEEKIKKANKRKSDAELILSSIEQEKQQYNNTSSEKN